MKIEFTKEQYRKLIELAYLGNWIANSTRIPGEERKEYAAIEQYIFSFAKDFDAEDMITYDKEFDAYYINREVEVSLEPIIEEYDNRTFWDELADRLAHRDLLREIGPVRKLTDQHMIRKFELEDEYNEEFEKNGLKNLYIRSK